MRLDITELFVFMCLAERCARPWGATVPLCRQSRMADSNVLDAGRGTLTLEGKKPPQTTLIATSN
jgi:hypothetical protein